MSNKTPAKRTRQGKAYPKLLKRHLEEIAFVVDLSADSEDLLCNVLARFKETANCWNIYEVTSFEKLNPNKNPLRFYWTLFVLSAAFHLSSLKEKQKELKIDDELNIGLPLHTNSPVVGPAVKYFHNIRAAVKSDRTITGYLAIPLDLRGSLHTEGLFRLIRDPRGTNYSRIEVNESLAAIRIHFWDINNFPTEVLSDKSQIDADNITLPIETVNPQDINSLIQKIVLSELWDNWQKGRKRKQNKNGQETLSKKHSYFKPIESVLQIETTGNHKVKDPIWFRPGGPLAIDFENNYVYADDTEMDFLKEKVLNNRVSMIEGGPGTGKTTVARSLAWKFHLEGKYSVYCLDCYSENTHSSEELIEEINCKEGIYIIENIHLKPFVIGEALKSLGHLTNTHILLTSVPMPEEKMNLHFPGIETYTSPFVITPLDYGLALIDKYCLTLNKTIDEKYSFQIIFGVTCNTKMLGHALEEYIRRDGDGELKEWVEVGVKLELLELERLNSNTQNPNDHNRIYPEIFLALAPLSSKDILTHEKFLLQYLNFDKEDSRALAQLVKHGKISCKNIDGDAYYGLRCQPLANVYWLCGKAYRKHRMFPDLEDFIYNYATFGFSNSLECVNNTTNDNDFKDIMHELLSNDKIATIIENTKDVKLIVKVFSRLNEVAFCSSQIAEAVIRNIKKCNSLLLGGSAISTFLSSESDIGMELWNQCKENLAGKLNQTTNFEEAEAFIDLLCYDPDRFFRDTFIYSERRDIIDELCDLLNPKRIAKNLLLSEQRYLESQCGSEGLCDLGGQPGVKKFLTSIAQNMPETYQDIMQFCFYGRPACKNGGCKTAQHILLSNFVKNGPVRLRLPVRIINTDHKKLE